MKNQETKTKKSRVYLVAFTVVTVLNIALAPYLVQISFGQTNESRFKDQPPLKVEIETQNDSPLRLTIINVDNTAPSYQLINYSIQNISSKKIKAYVTTYTYKTGISGTSISFPVKFIEGQIIQESIFEERVNIKQENRLLLSLDYVEFEDGAWWGKDSEHQSEYISGHFEGRRGAIKQIKHLITNQNRSYAVERFFDKNRA